MKKTIFNYGSMLAFIYLAYLLFAFVFACLFHYAKLQPTFYSLATKICSYTVILLAGLGFGLMTSEKRLLHGLLFCLIFSMINTLLLWHHFDFLNLMIKNIVFLVSVLFINFIKK